MDPENYVTYLEPEVSSLTGEKELLKTEIDRLKADKELLSNHIEDLIKRAERAEARLKKFEYASNRILKALKEGLLHHSIFCNFQHPSCTFCNCGLADLRQAMRGNNEPDTK